MPNVINPYGDKRFIFGDMTRGSTQEQKLFHDKDSYESRGIIWHLKHQWLPVDTEAIEKATGYTHRLQRRVFRSMAKRGEIGYKRIEGKSWINLNGGEYIEIPRPRPGRELIKGPTKYEDGMTHYLWCMTCKGTERLQKTQTTKSESGLIKHYRCYDCAKKRKESRTVPEERWRKAHNNWQASKKRAEKAEAELRALKIKYGEPLRKYHRWNPRPEDTEIY